MNIRHIIKAVNFGSRTLTSVLSAFLLLSGCSDSSGGNEDASTPFERAVHKANFARYHTGNYPLVISVPHGGASIRFDDSRELTLRDQTTNSSQSSDFSTETDSRTITLAELIDVEITKLTGRYSHLIYSNIKRDRVDLNRSIEDGVPYGNGVPIPISLQIYNEYHQYLRSATNKVAADFGCGLVIDVHGHSHSVQQTEIGYSLSMTELEYADATLNNSTYSSKSSIRSLAASVSSTTTFAELLRGDYSIGELLYKNDLSCVPRKNKPAPLAAESYFSGGHISRTYGSRDGGTVDAIQLEFCREARGVSPYPTENLDITAKAMAKAIVDYFKRHYTFTQSLD